MFTRKPLQNDALKRPAAPPPQRPQVSDTLGERMSDADTRVAALPADGLVVIGKGTRVFGKITDCRKLDVFGIVEADVIAEMIVVHEGGGLKGNVQTDKAEIHGIVEGTLQVYEHLEIHRTGEINCDVTYGSLSVAAGAKVVGSVQTHTDIRTAAPEPQALPNLAPVDTVANGAVSRNGSGAGATGATRPLMRH